MASDNINARKEEKESINVHDAFELRYWSNLFGVRKEDILEAVRTEGDTRVDIERYLLRNNLLGEK